MWLAVHRYSIDIPFSKLGKVSTSIHFTSESDSVYYLFIVDCGTIS